ncbi:EAL domain-containing response regulator [Shewanella spartinae]|uniref:EAL domain-containing response regulator n=1 Tax=Shewanella spartinae TaxID=2864205 RepID=UPI001C6587CA|nr:EAL domain-containing response regulator [Shewanella spartinae]QYJ95696.1 EAL domain-containing response regulator [Shewanella spartinae]
MNILIVDDQAFIREYIKNELLSLNYDHNFKIFEATSGNAAIEVLEESSIDGGNCIDLVIADLKMDNGDGLSIINHLATSRDKSISLAIISSSDIRTLELISNIVNGFNLNFVGVYQKPIDVNALLDNILKNQNDKELAPEPDVPVLCNEYNITELLNEDNLFLCYQPKIEIASGDIIGFEVLARLCLKGDGFIYPDKFIPLAERAGLNCQLTKLVLNQAISQWLLFPALKSYSLSVNISAGELMSVEFINYIIGKHNSNTDIKLMLELTESQDMINQEQTLQALAKLIINGIPISLDDFGKSYSTFDRLDNIPFEEIKIDKDFVCDLDSNSQHLAIVEATIALAQKLKVNVVAEGVETIGVLEKLKTLGCDRVQGYYFSPPIEGRHLLNWIDEYNKQKEAIYAKTNYKPKINRVL